MSSSALCSKILNWHQSNSNSFAIEGLAPNQFLAMLQELLPQLESILPRILIISHPNQIEDHVSFLNESIFEGNYSYFPKFDFDPFSKAVQSEKVLFERFSILNKFSEKKYPKILISSMESLLSFLPSSDLLESKKFTLSENEIIPPDQLAKSLANIGYRRTPTCEEPGTFSNRGEIFDIYTLSNAFRIRYFDDLIESIVEFNPEHQKSNKQATFSNISIFPTPHFVACDTEFKNNLRAALPNPGPQFKSRFERRNHILDRISNGLLFENYAALFPLFFSEKSTLVDYLLEANYFPIILGDHAITKDFEFYLDKLQAQYQKELTDVSSETIISSPENLLSQDINLVMKQKNIIVKDLVVGNVPSDSLASSVIIPVVSSRQFFQEVDSKFTNLHERIEEKIHLLNEIISNNGRISVCVQKTSTLKELQYLFSTHIEEANQPSITYHNIYLDYGFYLKNDNVFYLGEGDLFKKKAHRPKTKASQQNQDYFAEKISTLKVGDYVIHQSHGIGKYLGLDSISVGDIISDFLVILFDNDDKIYVPVYKINLIQKHADGSTHHRLENLRTAKFQQTKQRAKDAAKKLAFDLLQLNAQRETTKAFSFSPPGHLFHEFELSFPFTETPDQSNAIQSVIEDMQKPKPMDHLVCGDVGFGKTEVAMRAAFKAVLDKKQVAVLAPTTILTYQHYLSFKERFKNFAVEIDFLSRFKSNKETREIKDKIKEGKLDIIIGTHKLLSSDINWSDLGLVIIDEEHRFGVAHKEKLKLLKASVDFLTLTATPIPRTLQLSFLGLKNLSLIKTAPPRRQSIKTYIVHDDDIIIKEAIQSEIERGGQIYIVHNRVQDLESYACKILELVPGASLVMAHGQMNEKDLEKRISDFFLGKYQILLSTTIIESGIDIPNANTMIIDRADTFGLSQLHQLRGRIGRSDKKAYAYFIIPNRTLTEVAEQRIKALQMYSEIGSGFSIASTDMEIRGAGDILGGEQSGHIENIGLELYLELLQEAINEIRGKETERRADIEISTPYPAYIPKSLIPEPSLRLKTYKRLSSAKSLDELDKIKEDLADVYGEPPPEFSNLLFILSLKLLLSSCGVVSIKVFKGSIEIKFDHNFLELHKSFRENLVAFLLRSPKLYRLNQDYSFIFTPKQELTQENIYSLAKDIAQQINPC